MPPILSPSNGATVAPRLHNLSAAPCGLGGNAHCFITAPAGLGLYLRLSRCPTSPVHARLLLCRLVHLSKHAATAEHQSGRSANGSRPFRSGIIKWLEKWMQVIGLRRHPCKAKRTSFLCQSCFIDNLAGHFLRYEFLVQAT